MRKLDMQSGFSAVELLVTLFIAFLFVMMGYQLYSAIVRDSVDANAKATMSNSAQFWLIKITNGGVDPTLLSCTTPWQNTITNEGSVLTLKVTCPNPALPDLRLVTSNVTYRDLEVTHAIYTEI